MATLLTPTPPASPIGLDDLLADLCEALAITPTQFARAESAYHAVADWLRAPESKLAGRRIDIYPQGGLALRTTTKPRGREEYDVDLVCEVENSPPHSTQLYDLVRGRLAEHETYRKMLEEKKRCLRLNYEGEFHLDVLPARPRADVRPNAIDVPDTSRMQWHPTNPKDFTSWFEARCDTQLAIVQKRAKAPLPGPLSVEAAGPLRNAVRLLKRYRDNRFYGSIGDVAPRSIVLTTLAGHFYDGSDSLAGTIVAISGSIIAAKAQADGRRQRLVVLNPVTPSEEFSERWSDPACYMAFEQFVQALQADMARLASARGMDQFAEILEEMFGDGVGAMAVKKYATRVQTAREERSLQFTKAGGLTVGAAAAASAKPHTFHHGA